MVSGVLVDGAVADDYMYYDGDDTACVSFNT